MNRCAVCEKDYADDVTVCPVDGSAVGEPGAPPDAFVGRVIRGRYRVERQLGEGGMGTVYLAEQLSVGGRKVALKVLRADFARRRRLRDQVPSRSQARRRPQPGAQPARHHGPRLRPGRRRKPLHRHGMAEGQVLSEVIQRQGALGLPRAVRLATQIAEGLEAAHRAGVIHRDVKPQNIMVLAATDDIKLMDFGSPGFEDSSSHTQLTRTGVMLGTPAYMAPEQIEGGDDHPRVDIYAFGDRVLRDAHRAEAVPGQHDGRGADQATPGAPEAPSRLRPEIPREIEAIVLTALEKAPAHRQSSMGEIVRLLGEATRRMSDATRAAPAPASTRERAPPLRRRALRRATCRRPRCPCRTRR